MRFTWGSVWLRYHKTIFMWNKHQFIASTLRMFHLSSTVHTGPSNSVRYNLWFAVTPLRNHLNSITLISILVVTLPWSNNSCTLINDKREILLYLGCFVTCLHLVYAFQYKIWIHILKVTCLVLQLCGCTLLGVGIWIAVDRSFMATITGNPLYAVAAYIIIAGGGIIFIISFLGCCGAMTENRLMLLVVSDPSYCKYHTNGNEHNNIKW